MKKKPEKKSDSKPISKPIKSSPSRPAEPNKRSGTERRRLNEGTGPRKK